MHYICKPKLVKNYRSMEFSLNLYFYVLAHNYNKITLSEVEGSIYLFSLEKIHSPIQSVFKRKCMKDYRSCPDIQRAWKSLQQEKSWSNWKSMTFLSSAIGELKSQDKLLPSILERPMKIENSGQFTWSRSHWSQ